MLTKTLSIGLATGAVIAAGTQAYGQVNAVQNPPKTNLGMHKKTGKGLLFPVPAPRENTGKITDKSGSDSSDTGTDSTSTPASTPGSEPSGSVPGSNPTPISTPSSGPSGLGAGSYTPPINTAGSGPTGSEAAGTGAGGYPYPGSTAPGTPITNPVHPPLMRFPICGVGVVPMAALTMLAIGAMSFRARRKN